MHGERFGNGHANIGSKRIVLGLHGPFSRRLVPNNAKRLSKSRG